MRKKVSGLRREYQEKELSKMTVPKEPLKLFTSWFDQAMEAEFSEANAMALATVGPKGRPSVRMVLLKDFNRNGFTFYTNYESRKSNELKQNPAAALVFWWDKLERQIRIEGQVKMVSQRVSDAYFAGRPRGSQLAAWASGQSRTIQNYDALQNRWKEFESKFSGGEVPRPPFWGGYILIPDYYEFWRGRANRLHDRISYTLQEKDCWKIDRLAP